MSLYAVTERLGPMTTRDFEELPEEEGYRLDLVRGWVVREPSPGAEHGEIAAEVIRILANHARATRSGTVFTSETGFRLSDELRTVRGPDAAFVAVDRVREVGKPKGHFPGAPDLAVEVLSPSNRWSDVVEKIRDYLEAGTRIVWIIDPESRTVTVNRVSVPPAVLGEADLLDGADVLPGFSVRVGELFGES